MAINLKKKDEPVQWYLSTNGDRQGPFELNELLTRIRPDTQVWREGISWTAASEVPELASFFQTIEVTKPVVSDPGNFSAVQTEENSIPPQAQFDAPFSFDGRIRRTEYGISLIIYVVIYSFINNMSSSYSILALGYIPLLWFLWAQGAKRCHDRNNSGWFQIIPFYVLWMLFAEGDRTANAYGAPPK